MNMRETVNSVAKPRCANATYEDYLARCKITKDLSPEEREKRIVNLCRIFKHAADHLSENLLPNEIEKRIDYYDGVPCSLNEMINMHEENERVVGMIQRCVDDVSRDKTSLVFEECSKIYTDQKERFDDGEKALTRFLSREAENNQEIQKTIRRFTAELSCIALHIVPFCLAVEDMMAA